MNIQVEMFFFPKIPKVEVLFFFEYVSVDRLKYFYKYTLIFCSTARGGGGSFKNRRL